MTISVSVGIKNKNQLDVTITFGEPHEIASQHQGLLLLDSALKALITPRVVLSAHVDLAEESVLEQISQLLAGRSISFADDMPLASQEKWAQFLKPSTKLILSPTTSIDTAVALAKIITNPESLLYPDLPADTVTAIEHAFAAKTKVFEFPASRLWPHALDSVKNLPEGCVLQLGSGRAVSEDYADIVRAIPEGVVLEIPRGADEALQKAVKSLSPESRFTFAADISIEEVSQLFTILQSQSGYTVVLPAAMSMDIQKAIAAIVPRQCVLELSASTSLACAKELAANLKPGAILAAPTSVSGADGTPCDSHTWLNDIIGALHPSCDVKLPSGIALTALSALVLPLDKGVVLSKHMQSEEIAILAPVLRSSVGTIKLAPGMLPESLEALNTGRGDTGMGLGVFFHRHTSLLEANAVVSALGEKDKIWIPHSWKPVESLDNIRVACVSIAKQVAPGCSLGLLADSRQGAPIACASDIAHNLGKGAILRPGSTVQDIYLRALAGALNSGCIFEMSESILRKSPEAVANIVSNLADGVILRLPPKTTIEQVKAIQAVMAKKAVLEIPRFEINTLNSALNAMLAWINTLNPERVITFSSCFMGDVYLHYAGLINTPHLSDALVQEFRSFARKASREIFTKMITNLPAGCGIRFPHDIDIENAKQFAGALLGGRILWIPPHMPRQTVEAIIKRLSFACSIGIPHDNLGSADTLTTLNAIDSARASFQPLPTQPGVFLLQRSERSLADTSRAVVSSSSSTSASPQRSDGLSMPSLGSPNVGRGGARVRGNDGPLSASSPLRSSQSTSAVSESSPLPAISPVRRSTLVDDNNNMSPTRKRATPEGGEAARVMDDSPRAPRVSPHHGVSGGMPLFESPSRSSTGALSLPPKKRHQGADAHVAVDTASGPADSAPLLSSASPSMYGQSKAHDRRRKDAPLYIPTPAQGTRQATRERERERQTATTRGAPRGGRGTSNYR